MFSAMRPAQRIDRVRQAAAPKYESLRPTLCCEDRNPPKEINPPDSSVRSRVMFKTSKEAMNAICPLPALKL
jgi:hypothetical protein